MNTYYNEQRPKIRRSSLRYYLGKPMPADAKMIIEKKLKILFSMCKGIDSDPPDYYRYLGQQTIRLKLIEELNTFIMEYACGFEMIKPWAAELWELRDNCLDLIKTTEEMLWSLLHNGISTGMYKKDTSSKPTTAVGSTQ
jgi:hypothetical protein